MVVEARDESLEARPAIGPTMAAGEASDDLSQFLADAAERPRGHEVSIAIRDLIAKWGAKRRGAQCVQQVNESLEQFGLRSEPSFEEGWIDNIVRLVPVRVETAFEPDLTHPSTSDQDEPAAVPVAAPANKVRRLQSASGGVTSVSPEDSLAKAQSLMLRGDYSQLPVLSGTRKILGSVSWESIAHQQMHQPQCCLMDCIVAVDAVSLDDDLLPLVPKIIESGYVLVRESDNQVCGVITTSDLSSQFLTLAEPFLLVGELERQLRLIVSEKFTTAEVEGAKDSRDAARKVQGVDDLSLGELARLFEPKDRWDRHGWSMDRSVFIDALKRAVSLRNEIMHFSPDPIDEPSLSEARNLLKWLRLIHG